MLRRILAQCRFCGARRKWRILIMCLIILLLVNVYHVYTSVEPEAEIVTTKAARDLFKHPVNSNSLKHKHSTNSEAVEHTSPSTAYIKKDERNIAFNYNISETITWYTAQANDTVNAYLPQDFKNEKGGEDIVYHFSKSMKKEGPGFTLITMFNLFTGQAVDGYDKETKESLIQRNWEYLTTVRENLNHNQIKKLILLYTDVNSMKALLMQNWENITKVYPMKMDRLIHMSDSFSISSRYLIDEPIIATNGDIIIGENFDQIDTIRMRDSKTIYSLTRHGNKGYGRCEANSMCLMKYYGSHDTHIFRLKAPVSETALQIMNYPVNLQQAENGMIGTMTMEQFTVYNPCSILTTYHIHCSRIAKRLVRGNDSVKYPPWNVRVLKSCAPAKMLNYAS